MEDQGRGHRLAGVHVQDLTDEEAMVTRLEVPMVAADQGRDRPRDRGQAFSAVAHRHIGELVHDLGIREAQGEIGVIAGQHIDREMPALAEDLRVG